MLLVLLIAIASQGHVSGELGDSAARFSCFAHAADIVVNLGLSVGPRSLLLSNGRDQHGALQ